MFNVTVIKMKDIKKYLIGMIITIIAVVIGSNYFSTISEKSKKVQESIFQTSMVECLERAVPTVGVVNEEKDSLQEEISKIEKENKLQGILNTQISTIKTIQENINEKKVATKEEAKEQPKEENKEEKTEETKENKENKEENTEEKLQDSAMATQVITNNPLKESFNSQYQNIKIKNETEYQLTEEMLTPDVTTKNKNVILFHTHTCESYTSSDAYPYTPTGNFRTTDLNYTVVKVGTELENRLKEYNFNVVHDTTYHDYPSYNGSYAHSLATVENLVKTTPSDIIIDLHRDAIGSRSDYAPIVKIGDKDIAAQIMFVIRNK